jgi:hypothetical protein
VIASRARQEQHATQADSVEQVAEHDPPQCRSSMALSAGLSGRRNSSSVSFESRARVLPEYARSSGLNRRQPRYRSRPAAARRWPVVTIQVVCASASAMHLRTPGPLLFERLTHERGEIVAAARARPSAAARPHLRSGKLRRSEAIFGSSWRRRRLSTSGVVLIRWVGRPAFEAPAERAALAGDERNGPEHPGACALEARRAPSAGPRRRSRHAIHRLLDLVAIDSAEPLTRVAARLRALGRRAAKSHASTSSEPQECCHPFIPEVEAH